MTAPDSTPHPLTMMNNWYSFRFGMQESSIIVAFIPPICAMNPHHPRHLVSVLLFSNTIALHHLSFGFFFGLGCIVIPAIFQCAPFTLSLNTFTLCLLSPAPLFILPGTIPFPFSPPNFLCVPYSLQCRVVAITNAVVATRTDH
jgi:hypothetical protein